MERSWVLVRTVRVTLGKSTKAFQGGLGAGTGILHHSLSGRLSNRRHWVSGPDADDSEVASSDLPCPPTSGATADIPQLARMTTSEKDPHPVEPRFLQPDPK